MKKIAIFVEGQTEQIFVEKLLTEIAHEHNITISVERKTNKNEFTVLKGFEPNEDKRYYVLIKDCRGGGLVSCVRSDILEAYDRMIIENYENIIGLRDLYPIPIAETQKFEDTINDGLPEKVKLCFAIREIEAWFIAEYKHFSKIDNRLTNEIINQNRGYDVETIDVEGIESPAIELHNIYKLVGKSYEKTKNKAERTVNAIAYDDLYLSTVGRVKRLKQFVSTIDEILR
jgi:hypothetical protein